MTDDHVIAGAWYPQTTPSIVQRWTVPACRKCDNDYSAIERYVHARLAACINPTDPAAAGMWEKALRSINPQKAHNDRDRQHRTRQREAFWKELTELSQIPRSALPFSVPNFAKGSRTAIKIDSKKLNLLILKWARGIHRHIWGRPAPRDA